MSTNYEPVKGHVIFSLVDGTVWANWTGKSASVELGDYDTVTHMMRDFLAQCELGERLAGRKVNDG